MDRTERPMAASSDSILLGEIGSEWPLIRNLLDDRIYMEAYQGHLRTLHETAMHPGTLFDLMDSWHALAQANATDMAEAREQGLSDIDTALAN